MSDFKINADVDLNSAEAEAKLNALTKEKRTVKIDVEVNQDSAKKLTSNIEKGLSNTKIDTSSIANQLANSFNISDSKTINKLKSQMNSMVSSLAKTWNGKDFDFSKANGFFSGLNGLEQTVKNNAKVMKSSTGIYDDFFNYFKDKKIYVSDELKNAMGGDAYKELLQNNIGKIVRDATKGVSIDSIWGEMTTLFPEHFSSDITNQADQITKAFDAMKQARADMAQTFSVNDLSGADYIAATDSIAQEILSAATTMKETLQSNIMSATEAGKATLDLDVEINTDKITSDIRSAIQSAGNEAGEAINVDLKINNETLLSELRSAIGQLGTGEEPVKVNLQVDKESLQSDLNLALTDMELPVHFNIDSEEIESQLRSAIESITDMQIDLRINTNELQDSIDQTIHGATEQQEPEINIPQADTANINEAEQAIGRVNAAGQRGQGIFQSLGSSFREAFTSTYNLANMAQDGLFRLAEAGRSAVSTVKEFNDLETDLSMATGESRSYTKELMQDYNDMGQSLGAITSDVAESADSWLRQGRSMSETNQLIKDSMVLSKDAQMDSTQASEVLTATLNGFQMNADQASRINDILTSIDLESASDAGGIGQALTKVASQANNAGVSLEKTAAMIATIKDVTQASDDSIGNAMKSILARMNNIKAGKFVDDNGEALNDVEKVLNKIGISMRDNNDQFLDSEKIIDNVADKWGNFDKKTQKAVSTALGGTYQANSITALLDNYDKVQKLTDVALNSEGTAQKKFEDNYLSSLEAKTNSLKASMEDLATTTLSSDLYGGFLDGSKAVVDFANNINIVKSALAGLTVFGAARGVQQLVNTFRELSNFGTALNLSRMVDIPEDSFANLLTMTQGLSEAQTRAVLSSTALSEAQRIAILTNQGMSEAEAQASVAAMGLSAAEGTAAASTTTLSGALSGLWATLSANPLLLISLGVTAAVSAFNAYNNSVKEAVSNAKQAGTEWTDNYSSMNDTIAKVTELREALASGTLSEQEAASAKSELLSIQESLTESYGNQVSGIDLINGSLKEQIALLDQVSAKEAQSYQNENKRGIEKATKEMEKTRKAYLGSFYDNGSEESEAIKDSIKKLQQEYGDDTLQMESDGISVNVRFEGDVTSQKEVLNGYMTEMDNVESKYKTGTAALMSDYASDSLNKANDILNKYQEIYDAAQQAKIASDETLYKDSTGKEQSAAGWLRDYAKATDDYNNALSSGDTSKIAEAKTAFDEVNGSVSDLMLNSDMGMKFGDNFSEVKNQLDQATISANNFEKALSDSSNDKLQGFINDLKDLNLSDTDFEYALETDGIQAGEAAINGLAAEAEKAGVSTDQLISWLADLNVISSTTGNSVDDTTESVSGLADQIVNAQEALTGIQKATSILTSQSTGKSISLDDFNSEELADYTSALEYSNGALQLNTEKVRELQKAKAEEAIQTNENQKLEKQSQYMENIAQIEQLQDELRGLSDAKSENAQAIQNSIDALLSENDGIVNQCNQLDLLSASLREATGAYQNWLDKQNGSESGDMFDDAMGALTHIEDVTQNTESDDYGRIGTNSYKAAVDFIVPDTVDTQDAEAVSSYIDSIEHYFNHDSDGNRTGLDVAEFCAKATKAGLMELDEASGEYKIAGQRTMQDFADGLNLSLPMVQSMFGEMEEFGAKFDWSDEAVKTLGDLGMAAGEAKNRIEELSGDKDLDIQIDVSDIDTTEGKIQTLDNTIQQMQDYKGTLEVDSSQVDDANTIIQYCVTQKQMLETPAVMNVDTSQVDGELGNALSLLQQFQSAQNNVELQTAVGADTSEAQGKVDSLVSEIQGLSPEIQAKLNIDTTSEATLTSSIKALSPEIMVKAGVDSSVVDAYASEEKKSSGKVTWTNDTGSVDAWASQMHTSNGQVIWTNETSQVRTTFTATGTVNWTNTTAPTKGAGGASGTAHAGGTAHYNHLVGHAYANGNWGTKTGGTTLVGELGREIVVDPGSGTWHTVGDNGAEFVNIPAGSIVFNHLQSEALLERGFVNGRGTARANGTAMVRGGISVNQANIASGHTTYKGSSNSGSSDSSATQRHTDAVQKDTSATEDNTKSAKDSTEAFDWVKTKLDKFAKSVERISNQITDYISSTFKTVLLKRQVKAVEKQLKANEQGYTAYMDKANSIDISDDYKNKVINGTFSIEEIDTSSDSGKQLAKDIKQFQEFYNSAQDCKDTVQELNNKLLELYETIVNMPTEKAEKKIERLKTKLESLNAVSDTVSLGGSAIAAMQNQIKVNIPGLGNAQKKLDKAETARNATKKTRAKASKTLKSATADAESTGNTLIKASEKQTKSIGKKLKNAAKSSTNKATYNAIAQAIREGKAVNTKGLKGSALKYAKSYNSSLKQGNTIASKVKAGKTVKTSGMSNILKSTAQAYNVDAKEKASAQKIYNTAKKADEKALDNLTKAQKNKEKLYAGSTKEQQILATTKGKKSYVYQNMLLTQETKNLKEQNKQRQKALKETRDSYMKAKSKSDTADADKAKSQKKLLNNKTVMSKLSKTQQKALKAGKTVSTKGITDPKVLKWIQDYNEKVKKSADLSKKLRIEQEALDKATSEAAQSQAEYAQSIVENAKKKLENIANYYDSFTSQWENRNSMYEAYMDRMQTQGYNLSTKFYEAEIGQQQKIVDNLSQKYIAMKRNFAQAVQDGKIKEGTEEYYEMQNEIDQVAISLKEAQNKVVEFQASIRDLKWEQFDQLQEAIGRITSESDFLIDLMSHKDMYDKDGKMTEQGLATMGLHGVNYNTYMAQADKYKEEMLKISEELANDPNNQKLIDRKNELIDAQQQAILSAENEKDSIKDLIQDGIDKQLDALDDLIDKYLDCLDSEKDLYEYRKKIGEQSEKIASLQKQLSSLQGDDSEENKAKLQKLKEDLKSAQDDMEETQYDKYISDQKKLLDELKQDYKKALDDRMDNVDVLISDAIASINSNSSNISQTLQTESTKVGYTLSGEMQTIWTSQSQVLSMYDGKFDTRFTGVTTAIGNVYDRQKDMIDAINTMAEKWITKADQMLQQPTQTKGVLEKVEQKPDKDNVAEGNPTPDPQKVSDDESIRDAVLVDPDEPDPPKKKPNKTNEPKTGNNKAEVGDKVTFSSGRYYEASDGTGASGNMYLGKKVKITRINKGSKYPYAIDATDGTELGWVKLNQLKGYASGIMRVPNDQLAWTQEQGEEAIVRNDGSILTPLSRDVSVLNADMTKNLWDFMGNPGSFLSDYSDGEKFGVKNVDNSSSVVNQFDNLTFNLPNVQNTDDFIKEMARNKKFEKLICAMTIDRAMSGSSLAKYKYKK